MSARTVYTYKLVNRQGSDYTPADGIYRLGINSDPSADSKSTFITAGVYLEDPGTEFYYYRNNAFRPLSSQGAHFTSRSIDPANPLLSSGAIGFRQYSHIIGHTDNPATSVLNPSQVTRTYLPTGKGTYMLWMYVEYDTARAVDLTISISGVATLATVMFPSSTKYANVFANYTKTSSLGQEVLWTYTTSPDLPRIIRTAIVKTGDIA